MLGNLVFPLGCLNARQGGRVAAAESLLRHPAKQQLSAWSPPTAASAEKTLPRSSCATEQLPRRFEMLHPRDAQDLWAPAVTSRIAPPEPRHPAAAKGGEGPLGTSCDESYRTTRTAAVFRCSGLRPASNDNGKGNDEAGGRRQGNGNGARRETCASMARLGGMGRLHRLT